MDFIFRLARQGIQRLTEEHDAFKRAELHEGVVEVRERWKVYVRRNTIRTPVLHDVAWFLWTEYRLPMLDEDVVSILGPTAYRVELRMDKAFPRLAALLLDGGVLPVERP
jgi:hypothetical protein